MSSYSTGFPPLDAYLQWCTALAEGCGKAMQDQNARAQRSAAGLKAEALIAAGRVKSNALNTVLPARDEWVKRGCRPEDLPKDPAVAAAVVCGASNREAMRLLKVAVDNSPWAGWITIGERTRDDRDW